MPSMDGWTIVCDPNGGTNNYVEMEGTAGVPVDFVWTMKAPSTAGTYRLMTRVHVGPGPIYEDDTSGLVFQVTDTPSGTPMVDHTPVTSAFTEESIKVQAAIKDASIAKLYWKSESEQKFQEVEMTKVSEVPDGQMTFEAEIPSQTEEGIIEYYINATNGGLYSVTPTARIAVTVEPERPNVAAWGLQNLIILEVIGIFAFFSVRLIAKNGRAKSKKGGDESG
jgi:hypothetical protein